MRAGIKQIHNIGSGELNYARKADIKLRAVL